MSSNPLPLILHGAALGIMSWGYNSMDNIVANNRPWIAAQKGSHFQYLTIQGLALSCVTMLFGLADDVLPSVRAFRIVKRSLFMVAMPVAVVVFVVYWPLIIFAPVLIVTQETAARSTTLLIPLKTDLALHAVPPIALSLDFFLFEKRYSKNQALYGAPVITVLTAISYVSCAEYLASFNGTFPYEFLNTTLEIRAAIYVGATIIALVSFWTLNAIHR